MKSVIISLGGSVVYPKKFDSSFVKRFAGIVSSTQHRYAILCGGGFLARRWQEYGKRLFLPKYLLDWLGILATRKNASMVRKFFRDNVHKKIITNPTKKLHFNEKVLVAAGWKPGWSTDFDAVLLAKNLGIGSVINISNIDHVYSKDPRKNRDARPLKHISWKSFRKIVGDQWSPGLNMPFDPIASREAQKLGIKVYVIGKSLKNLASLLEGKKFKGTLISD